uniref:Vacuolar protein sorting 13 homolog C n=1 Tax=Propithecus coquereli TaxID=379532 RepID=A0A2K6GHK6_PROCO
MVLESVVADLLNRFLGDYVENLNKSQLKLGIWGGKRPLNFFFLLKYELDVPFKVKAGQIDKLTLKIPWKNLYGEAVVATLEGLYLLVVPGIITPTPLENKIFQPISASAKLYMNPYAETELKTPKLDWNIEVQNIAIELTKPQVQFIWTFLALFNLEFSLFLSFVIIASIVVIRSGQKLRKKSADKGEKRGGWFSGFWGKKESKKKDEESLIPESKLKSDNVLYTDKKKLCKLYIYVAHIMTLKLVSTSITIREDRNIPEILKIQVIGLGTQVSQRPGAQALKVEAKLEHWYITGLRQQDTIPSLVASIGDTASSLLKIEFETNPDNSPADQTLIFESQPVEVIYDAKTINAVVDFFQSNKGLDLEQITSATLMKLEEIKEKTATGKKFDGEKEQPCYFVVTGLNSKDQGLQKTTNSSLEEIMDKAYDKFDIEIKSVQLLFARAECKLHEDRTMNILVILVSSVAKADVKTLQLNCIFRFKVTGGLPLMHVRISDQKMKDVLCLINSIPLPQKSSAQSPERQVNGYNTNAKSLIFTTVLEEFIEIPLIKGLLFSFYKQRKKPLHLISSSDKPGLDLLKVEYIKADKNGPSFQTTFGKTEQTVKVAFSSLNLLLQAQALLSSINYLTTIIPSDNQDIGVAKEVQIPPEKQQKNSTLQKGMKTHFNFLLERNFLNNFQTAKESLSAATAQAAEKAATSVKDLAQRSFRASINIDLKAPVIIIPQSSVSTNAVVVDLGLIRVQNQFSLVSGEDYVNPPVIDKMDVQLTKLTLSRTVIQPGISHPDIQMLHPINLEFFVNRNLAASWYHKVPVVEIKGHLDSMNVSEIKEPLEISISQQDVHASKDTLTTGVEEIRSVDIINMLLNFEIKEVVVTLMKKAEKKGRPLQELNILHLGMEARVKTYDMTAEAYLKKISMRCFDFTGECAISSTNSLSFLTKTGFCYFLVSSNASQKDVFDLKVTAELNAFNIFICDQKCNIADIKIHGLDASISVKPKQTDVFARLKDIIVTNVDLLSIHKKAVSILGDEVFRFQLTLYPDATEGAAYADMSKVDGKLSFKVGCIQIVYVHKFFMSLLVSLLFKCIYFLLRLKYFCLFLGKCNVYMTLTILQAGSPQYDIEILKPVNMLLSIQRNLSATWYVQIPGMEIKGKLKPMQVALSQDDLTTLMKILLENLGEASSQPSPTQSVQEAMRVRKVDVPSGLDHLKEQEDLTDPKLSVNQNVTLQFDFHFESLSIILYNDDVNQESKLSLHNDTFRLGELRLHFMASAGKMFKDGSMNVSIKLKTCTLDDLREGIERATSRMIDKKNDQDNNSSMIDISYKQDKNGSHIDAVLYKLYVCASVEFLMIVADFFIKAVPQSPENMAKETQFPRQTVTGKVKTEKDDSVRPNMTLKATITDPEVVFVANLTKADAPALTASFQCNLSLSTSKLEQMMEASVRDLKVLACPFLREKRGKNITTVLQPCSLFMEKCTWASGKQNINIMVKEFIIKISPIILNTVMTIMAAMSPKTKEDESKDTSKEMENLWGVKSINDYNSWFLGVDTATEITENFQDIQHPLIEENCAVVVESIQVTLECGLGHRTVPLLLAESRFSGNIKNWTSLMVAATDMTLEVHYYNEIHAVWEPLIERVEGKRQWNLRLDVKKNPVQDKSLMPGDDFIPEPQMAIRISSRDTMNITISKSLCLILAWNISKGTASTFDYSLKDKAPFTVKNAVGIPIKVRPNCNLRVMGSPEKTDIFDVDAGQNLELEYASMEPSHQGKQSTLSRQESSYFTLTFVPHGYTEVGNIPVARPGRRLYNVRNPNTSHSDSIVVQIDATEGNKVITLRSPLQIKNHFSIAFIIYKFVKNVKLLERIGIARPEEEFHVPLDSYRCQLFIQPAGLLERQYKESTTYISWKEELHRSREVRCMLQCPSAEVSFLPLIVNTVALPDELSYICTHGEDWDPAYIIHLYPPLTLRNLLPYSLRYLLEGTAETHELAEGSTADVLHSRIGGEIMELVLVKYQGKNWNGHFRISDTLPEFFLVCFSSDSTEVMTIDLSVHVRRIGSRMVLSVFSPYWLINKTSRVLQYRSEDVHVKHPADFRDIILFSFKKKNIFSKNKVQLKISTSAWSNSFSLDTVGNYGCVKCPANNMEYLVGVSIKMSSFNLSRIVTLTPFCTIANKSSLELEVGEIVSDGSVPTIKWNYIGSSECLPFWPENLSGKLCVRVVGCEGSSKPFFYNRQDNGTLLSIEDLNCGILVDVNTAEHSTVITFSDYHEGSAPALIINHTPWDILTYKQSGSLEQVELPPRQARLFAWADPTGTRKLTWKYAANVGEHNLLKDECGQFPYDANIQIHWVSFLDGRQRVLLFTDDVALVSKALQAEEMEQADHEITLSLHSLGLSLVNNEIKQEVSYIGITSSGVVWEMKPKQKWKPFSQKQIILLEQSYQKYQVSRDPGWIKLDSNFEVNFNKVPMEMRLPIRCPIKRDFLSGIQIEFKQSRHQRSLRARLYWLQIDNQLPGAMFPVVFHPVAPPKSIALDSEPKPFIDVSVITRFNEYSKVLQFKYFMVLIQEMALKVDQGFLGAIVVLFTPTTDPEAERRRTKLIQKDIDALNTELMETSMTDMSILSFFEHFHISPVKLHLSLSLGSGGEESGKEKEEMIAIHSANLLLKSIGATLTDVDDLIFKLAYYEIRYQFYKRDQLMWSVVRHYSEQFLKQMYVLVLGLDVLGNPFGLIRGLSEGVEALFYEPFQGAVQGPEEFAEGLVIGVRSLFGHTVGGAAGVVSRITGSVGKGLAAITMDKEYQQKRREELSRQPRDFGDSLARGGKGFLQGVVGGVTGIITKPVEGAKKEGAAGFFKGIGKGLVGAVARPTGGIIDMASSTFQGIQRAAESTEEVSSLRPPRLIHEDGIIRPYDRQESEGYDIFENRIKKLEGETYRYHCAIPGSKRTILMVTNRRVLCVKEVEILGHMSIDWQYPFEDFVCPPSVNENVLKISVKEQGLFHKKDSASQGCLRKIYLKDTTTAERAYHAIEDAQSTRHQQKLMKQSSLRLLRPQIPS